MSNGIYLTKHEWATFQESEIGSKILHQVKQVKRGIEESICAGGALEEDIERTAITYALNVGQIQGLNWLLEPSIVEEKEE